MSLWRFKLEIQPIVLFCQRISAAPPYFVLMIQFQFSLCHLQTFPHQQVFPHIRTGPVMEMRRDIRLVLHLRICLKDSFCPAVRVRHVDLHTDCLEH